MFTLSWMSFSIQCSYYLTVRDLFLKYSECTIQKMKIHGQVLFISSLTSSVCVRLRVCDEETEMSLLRCTSPSTQEL